MIGVDWYTVSDLCLARPASKAYTTHAQTRGRPLQGDWEAHVLLTPSSCMVSLLPPTVVRISSDTKT